MAKRRQPRSHRGTQNTTSGAVRWHREKHRFHYQHRAVIGALVMALKTGYQLDRCGKT